ncbi:glycosyltransferase family 2 protein [Enterococcus casseliflavus]|uniref:glycosyltransferase family 2 protein n=1 Tax=Enterococcus casseliflavus TaxID=37734 RepID=UPI0039A4919F
MATYDLSVIVPVYNGDKYLSSLLKYMRKSIRNKNIEVIVINDGSTDNTKQILNQVRDKNFKVIHQENMGVSAARNCGISNACGKYITFIDSDDSFDDNYFDQFIQNINGNHYFMYANLIKTNNKITKNLDVFSKKNIIEIENHVTSRFFLKSLLEEHKINFNEDLTIGEDFLFLFTYIWHCKDKNSILHLDKTSYYYNYEPTSIMNSSDFSLKLNNINQGIQRLNLLYKGNDQVKYLAIKNCFYRIIPELVKKNICYQDKEKIIKKQIKFLNNEFPDLFIFLNNYSKTYSYLNNKIGYANVRLTRNMFSNKSHKASYLKTLILLILIFFHKLVGEKY